MLLLRVAILSGQGNILYTQRSVSKEEGTVFDRNIKRTFCVVRCACNLKFECARSCGFCCDPGSPSVCNLSYGADKTPCCSTSNSAVVDASNLTPPPATDAAIKQRRRKTDDNGNTMLQSLLSKRFRKEIGWRYSRSAAVVKTEKCPFFQHYLFTPLHAAGFDIKIVITLIKNSSRDDCPWISTFNLTTANIVRVGQVL